MKKKKIHGPEVIKLFSCSTQLSMKFIMLINVKMPTIVGILTFISRINTTSESLKARKVFVFRHFKFYEQLKFHAQLSMIFFITMEPGMIRVLKLYLWNGQRRMLVTTCCKVSSVINRNFLYQL